MINFLTTKKMEKIKIKQVRSSIKNLRKQKLTLFALGLRGIGKEVVHENTPNIRGMIERVNHLVEVIKI
ncbi:MAG: 50S ribosomal protein L30 [Flavobacteriaceae bacterium]